ncbi:MAG: serine/threonine protein kinase [Betaproteobacteria bacterium]|nr:serine/threonine protein kinase [Betaproteobacteria bacterium]PWB65711.1 MAG: serine/threonine protein kinase [Betaproteobacteria bacterium]
MPSPLHEGAARPGAGGPHRPGASRRPASPIPGRPYNARVSADLSPHPYASLTPDTVLDAVESVGFRADGHQLALNSYENRVYQVGLEEDQGGPLGEARFLVAKFYRPGRWSDEEILEEHAFAAELAAREIPVVPALELGGTTLHHHAGFRFAVYPRRGGRAPELEDRNTLEWLGRFIGRIHAVGATKPFVHRPGLDVASFGTASRDWLLGHDFIPADLREAWSGAASLAIEGAQRAFDRATGVARIRLHGDCHAGNVLWTPAGPHFVDFDDARTGPAVQDLWMLLSGDRASMSAQLRHVLAGYEDFASFDDHELGLVEALRTLRLLHYSAWLARRWDDPAFPMAFPWFNTQKYWQDRVLELKEQVAAMQEPPLAP